MGFRYQSRFKGIICEHLMPIFVFSSGNLKYVWDFGLWLGLKKVIYVQLCLQGSLLKIQYSAAPSHTFKQT